VHESMRLARDERTALAEGNATAREKVRAVAASLERDCGEQQRGEDRDQCSSSALALLVDGAFTRSSMPVPLGSLSWG